MKLLKGIFARIWALWALIVFVATMLICFIFMLPCFFLKDPQRAALQKNVSKVWMRIFLTLTLVFIKTKNKKVFQKGKNYILVCNHNSFMDVMITNPFVPNVAKTIAKKSFVKVPILGWIYTWGSVLVDRKNTQSRTQSYGEMKDVLSTGMSMLIFPEGTRNKTSKPLGNFQNGAFRLAIDTQKGIIPIVLFNTKKILQEDKFYMLPGIVEVHYLPPINPANKTADELKQNIYEIMWNYYEANY
ncbi:glycerol acyltransferase [Arachidicoccus ginsenosidimutans]|uniref:lysophospholipid acyltransferase family protein n=1 Tax=Arachidicoccus sp. BS20 TaxID=1850526 RepID=UPI0007F17ED3|nr:lysophospholipid acyltransferase family protein [Arachidicoccus sp. BS20]ANI88425.1 glycerol acyltransferase [Arachidicoccus sp. BS20]